MLSRKVFAALLIFAALLLFISKVEKSKINVGIAAGFDEEGKYFLIAPDRGGFLKKVVIGTSEIEVNEEAAPKDPIKVYYNWEPRREYKVSAVFERGVSTAAHTAPQQRSELHPNVSFYWAGYGEQAKLTAVLDFFSVENDNVRVYLGEAFPSRVYILEYPTVLTSKNAFEKFKDALISELRKTGVSVSEVSDAGEAELEEGVLISANGALPVEIAERILNESKKEGSVSVIYIGTPPGEFLVSRTGSVRSAAPWREIKKESSPAEQGGIAFKNSAYTIPNAYPIAKRADGFPGVFRAGKVLIFSNTLDEGWSSYEDAVRDTVMAVVSNGYGAYSFRSFELKRDARRVVSLLSAEAPKLENVASKNASAVFVAERDKQLVYGKTLAGFAAPPEGRIELPQNALPGDVYSVLRARGNGTHHLKIEALRDGGKSTEFEVGRVKIMDTFVERFQFSLPQPGDYLVKLVRDGDVVGSSLVHVHEIKVLTHESSEGTVIRIYQDEKPYEGKVSISTDGAEIYSGHFKDYYAARRAGNVAVEINGVFYEPSKRTQRKFIELEPVHVALLAVLALVAAFNLIAGRKERIVIALHFSSPEEKQRIRIPVKRVLELFTLYNIRRSLPYTPLSAEEMQRALYLFGGLLDSYPSLEEVKQALEKMKDLKDEKRKELKDYVEEALGVYAPKMWSIETGQGIYHMGMVKHVYDYFIRRGFLAKPIMNRSKEAGGYANLPDVIAVGNGERIYVECETGRKKDSLPELIGSYIALYEELRMNPLPESLQHYKESLWVVLSEELWDRYAREAWRGSENLKEWADSYAREGKVFVKSIKEFTATSRS